MSYQECLENAMRIRKVSSPDDECIHLAKGLVKLKRGYDTHAQKKRDRSAILILDTAPVVEFKLVKSSNICQSLTLKGKRCTFKAVCGNYCKKHNVKQDDMVLGKKCVVGS